MSQPFRPFPGPRWPVDSTSSMEFPISVLTIKCTVFDQGAWNKQTDGQTDGPQHCFRGGRHNLSVFVHTWASAFLSHGQTDRERDRRTERRIERLWTDPFEPGRHFVLAVAADVRLDDDDGDERRQRDENHVHAEVGTCTGKGKVCHSPSGVYRMQQNSTPLLSSSAWIVTVCDRCKSMVLSKTKWMKQR